MCQVPRARQPHPPAPSSYRSGEFINTKDTKAGIKGKGWEGGVKDLLWKILYVLEAGDPRCAIDYHEQTLAITKETGDRRGEGNQLTNLGWAYKQLGEIEKVREYWQAALAIFLAIEDPNAAKYAQLLADLDKPGG